MENTELQTFKIMSIEDAKQRYAEFVSFSKAILKDKRDYGVIPGVSKPSLFKPGAEKLRVAYGLGVGIERTGETLDLVNDFYDVNYLATVKDRSGNIIAQCEGSANTSEDKYKYTWLPATKPAESEINKMKAEKRGRRKKEYNGDYTRLEKKEADNRISLKNTIQKIAQKRAFVGAILMATGASEFYTQDVEDMNIGGNVVEGEVVEKKEEKYEGNTTLKEKPRFNQPEFDALTKEQIEAFLSADAFIEDLEMKYKISRAMKENLVEKFDDVKVSKTLPDTNQQDDGLPF